MRTFIRFLIVALPLSILASNGYAQREIIELGKYKVNIATNEVPFVRLAPPFVVLSWPAHSEFTQFNLYRKSNELEAYSKLPLNGELPIAVLTNCDEIKAWIPEGGPDWNLIGDMLGTEDNPYDPCAIADLVRDTTPYERLQMLARGNWKIAVVAGQGFRDENVKAGNTYYYELRGVEPREKKETILATDIPIIAGSPTKLAAPSKIDAIPDDSKNLVLWSDVTNAAGYLVYRATDSAFAASQRINEATLPMRFTKDLQDNPITEANGFVDYMMWDEYGNPTPRMVNGINITGPFNGEKYYYKVSAMDMLGNKGLLSAAAAATPSDKTPPMTPQDISVTANNPLNRLDLRWSKVAYDVSGHAEDSIQGYLVYRYDVPDATTSAVPVGGLIPQPAAGFEFVTLSDNDPVLRPVYGEKTFWYRIKCIDAKGNESALSAAASGYLKDVTAPDPPKNVKAEGFESFIRVMWDMNSEPDLDGYLIYRSLCEYGVWTCVSEESRHRQEYNKQKQCPETFALVGYVSRDEAKAFLEAGQPPQFDDASVPAGSPLCYAYLVKAIDRAQNESGKMPPDLTKEEVVCQRLRDKTPPDPAIISSLLARDSYNRVEWIGAPVQDIAAYHVYRSENEAGPYNWVGGMTVERPPAVSVPLAAPYAPPAMVDCKQIALVPMEYMSSGVLEDKTVEPKIVYWYKVLGVDANGNESKVDDAVPVSTFTFSTNVPPAPAIGGVTVQSPTCALVVNWTPTYNASIHRGFVVFRSRSTTSQFLQVSDLIIGNQYVDAHVARNTEYWYKVLEIDQLGNLSPLSAAVSGKASP